MRLGPVTALLLIAAGAASAAPARELVLISGFEPFGRTNGTNNSWVVAEEAARQLRAKGVDARTCLLPTVYDRGAEKLEECVSLLPRTPDLVLSLGEGPCQVHLETQVYNLDHNPRRPGISPDNEGVRRTRRTIIPGAPFNLGLRLDAQAIYCSLTPEQQAFTKVSTTPGNFVCNNAAYRFSHAHPELPYGFVHVPAQTCRGEAELRVRAASVVQGLVEGHLRAQAQAPRGWPHPGNDLRLPTQRQVVRGLLSGQQGCHRQFIEEWLQNF